MNNWRAESITVERILDLLVCNAQIQVCDFYSDTKFIAIDCEPVTMEFWSSTTGEVWEHNSTFLNRVLDSAVGEIQPVEDKVIIKVFIDDLEPFLR